jgi:predicted MFS family arabinose efflux permease
VFPVFVLVLSLSVLGALPLVALEVTLTTVLQRRVPEEYRGRVFGTMETSMALAVLVGMGLGVLGGLLAVLVVLAVAGVIDLGFGVVAGIVLHETRHDWTTDDTDRLVASH